MAAVKGMAMAGQIPCVGVSTLLSLAYNVAARDGVVCTVLDARAGQVYAAVFKTSAGRVERLSPDAAMALDALGELLPDGAMAVGDGAALCAARFPGKKLLLAPSPLRFQRAASGGCAAFELPAVSAEQLALDYHRKPQAEREREARGPNRKEEGV
jgi:tRNA threonylcarbamoyladenosine biosynthesis protein TsaB